MAIAYIWREYAASECNAQQGTDLYTGQGTPLIQAECIELFKQLGTEMKPELKSPSVNVPCEDGCTQQRYALRNRLHEYWNLSQLRFHTQSQVLG